MFGNPDSFDKFMLSRIVFGITLFLSLITGLWMVLPVGAEAANTAVFYLDENGVEQSIDNYTIIDESTIDTINNLDGWYLVRGTIARSETLIVSGTAHLILEDNAHLAIQSSTAAGINVSQARGLNVYAQSVNDGMGELNVTGGNRGAGIGGSFIGSGGAVTINGGIVTAVGSNLGGAGIGGSNSGSGGAVTINGGIVTAVGGNNGIGTYSSGAGIGGGAWGAGGAVTINGGIVTTVGGNGVAGIGSGTTSSGNSGTLTLPRAYSWWANTNTSAPGGLGTLYFSGNTDAYIYDVEHEYIKIVSESIAIVNNVTISGTVGMPLEPQSATITLYGGTLSEGILNSSANAWFRGLPGGIDIDIKDVIINGDNGDTFITLMFSGTPTSSFSEIFDITILASALTNRKELAVQSNADAKFDIQGSFSATIDPTDHIFPAAAVGYNNSNFAKLFKLRNTGTETITNLSFTFADSANFELSTSQNTDSFLASGGEINISVRPKNNLVAGTYTDTLLITGNKDIRINVPLSFTVNDTQEQYKVIQHFGTFTKSGGTRTGKTNVPHTKFVRLLLNGKVVDPDHYIVTQGSTIITLKESYLKTLADGTYLFRKEHTDGYLDLKLTVDVQGGITAPLTGDNSSLITWIAILLLSATVGTLGKYGFPTCS